jgi:hypothetical protein
MYSVLVYIPPYYPADLSKSTAGPLACINQSDKRQYAEVYEQKIISRYSVWECAYEYDESNSIHLYI